MCQQKRVTDKANPARRRANSLRREKKKRRIFIIHLDLPYA
jgi:hypothetical protein